MPPAFVQVVDQLCHIGVGILPLMQSDEEGILQCDSGAGTGELNRADTRNELYLFGAAADPGQQLASRNIQVAPAAHHAILALADLPLRVFQNIFLVPVGHGADLGPGGPLGHYVQHRLESHYQIGLFEGVPALHGQHPGIAGANRHHSHGDS